jgi:hypothetical protein
MNPTPTYKVPQSSGHHLRYQMALVALMITGPTLLSAYVFAVWCLTANMRLTNSFPWSAGPLSNWMIWLCLALLLNIIAKNFHNAKQIRWLRAGLGS